ncbi:MAG: type III-A CRISPR-associated RAMP protein Csm5 [Bacillota bacterium]
MQLTLKTITPLHVGSGEKLSPYSDYIYHQGQVYYVDHKKLENYFFKLENAQELIDDFVEIIGRQAGGNSKDRYKLKKFFDNNNLNFKQFTSKAVSATGKIKGEEIQRIMLTGNRPYVPGSTIKGAVRTALLYTHLKEDGYNLSKMNKGYMGEDVFGQYGDDILKFLHLSDSNPLSEDDLEVVKTYRVGIEKGDTKIPITREAINTGKRVEFKLQSKAKKNYHNLNRKFDYLYQDEASNSNQSEKEILTRINECYIELLEREINALEDNAAREFRNIINLYRSLQNQALEFKENKQGAIMRLGAGKTYFDNTVANLFSQRDLRVVKKRAGFGTDTPFPKTRTAISSEEEIKNVLGWVAVMKDAQDKVNVSAIDSSDKDKNDANSSNEENNSSKQYKNLKEFVTNKYSAKAFKNAALLKRSGKTKKYKKYEQEFETYKKINQ